MYLWYVSIAVEYDTLGYNVLPYALLLLYGV